MKNNRKVISISLPKKTAEEVEKARSDLGMTRSEFFRYMIRDNIEGGFNISRLADEGGAFDFLKKEKDLYSTEDIK